MSSSTAVVTGPISVGSWVKRTPSPRSRSNSAWTSSTANAVNGMPSATSAVLERLRRWVCVGFEDELGAARILRGHHGDPPMLTHRNVVLLLETEDLGIEPQRLVLVVNEHAGQIDSHGRSLPPVAGAGASAATGILPGLLEPPLDDWFERRGVDVVELVPALAAGLDQARGLEDVEVLRDRLPRGAEAVLGRQPRAELEERLPVPVGQLVKDRCGGWDRPRL